MRVARRILIMIGSLTAAYLSVNLVGGVLLQVITGSPAAWTDPRLGGVIAVVILVLGGLIYRDIIRRELATAVDRKA